MRIATLQFAAKLGDLEGNIKRANELLERGKAVSDNGQMTDAANLRPDILVLPECALTGYNFPSLEAIRPYLEPAGQGRSAEWARETARRLRCKVCVGYPEIEKTETGPASGDHQETCYNSLLVVDENGDLLLNYRKAFLYYADLPWAAEGDMERGFLKVPLGNQQETMKQVDTSFGICMDINPYKFEAPFDAWEFANRVIDTKSQLVILSMAWLTLLDKEDLDDLADEPELETFNYWIMRFVPLITRKMEHESAIDGDRNKKIVIVFANRTGEEPSTGDKPPARYAGTSAIIAVTQRPRRRSGVGPSASPDEADPHASADEDGDGSFDANILCWDWMGATNEGICFADTDESPERVLDLMTPLSL